MTYNPEIHHRRSIRLPDYDYSRWGAYFLTICTQDKRCLLGRVANEELELNEPGQMVYDLWQNLADTYHGVHVDTFIVMPNHLHGILVLPGNENGRLGHNPPIAGADQKDEKDSKSAKTPELGRIVKGFKTYTMQRYGEGVRKRNWEPYSRRLWQRNYYEHIIRTQEERNAIREYIRLNPNRWGKNRDQSDLAPGPYL